MTTAQTNTEPADLAGQEIAEYATNKGWSGRGDLRSLLKELERQKDSMLDFVADTRTVRARAVDKETSSTQLQLEADDAQTGEWLTEPHPLTRLALLQLGARLDPEIPGRFLETLATRRPVRAATLLNGLMEDTGRRVMVRCLDGVVRAVVSDRYRILDHYSIAFAAMDAAEKGGGKVLEASLSDRRMVLKIIAGEVWEQLAIVQDEKKGGWYAGGLGSQQYLSRVAARSWGDMRGGPNAVHPLVTVHNSETGHGGYYVRLGIAAAVCFNLATVETVVSQIHAGSAIEPGIFRPETMAIENQAIIAKATDMVSAGFDREKFAVMVQRLRAAESDEITAPAAVVDHLIDVDATIPKSRRDELLSHFLGGDYAQTRLGLSQAVGRLAQDEPNPDKAEDYEALAGKLLITPKLVKVPETVAS